MQHLLEQAGYADTRVATPPAERVQRRIKKTFDEVDAEEVRDLYSTFGLSEHRVTHITEPGLPLKSSSSLLRNLAAQGNTYSQENYDPHGTPQLGSSYDTWWGGGFAALGRAAKAVMEMSPPSKGNERFEEVARQMSSGVGLGLAKGGEGVRKVKSNWELGHEALDQEQIPPVPPSRERKPANTTPLPPVNLPLVNAMDQDEFGFSPLPADYEAQCDDDEFFTTSFDVGSLDSSPIARTREGSSETEEHAVYAAQLDEINQVDDSPRSVKSLGFGLSGIMNQDIGKRIMAEAVDYDDYDQESPTKKSFVKPLPPAAAIEEVVEEFASVPEDTPAPEPVPFRKYADRATKLRLARSTPILTPRPNPGWFGSIRSYINPASSSTYSALPLDPPSAAPAPIKLTPALPAIPTLAKPVTVVCDSTSDMAEDLPAIPPTITVTAPQSTIGSIALRTRKSLAQLKSVITGEPAPPLPTSTPAETPVLSPRLDLAESEYFAGWSPRRNNDNRSHGPEWSTPTKADSQVDGYGPTEIDYTRSFFYKPCTPPAPSTSTSTTSETYNYSSTSTTVPAGLVARRQRSIKSLRAALLLPVAPPVPVIPDQYRNVITNRSTSGSTVASTTLATPPQKAGERLPEPPILAILSPGAWEAGLPARELVLEGEEWDARDGQVGKWSKGKEAIKGKGGKGKLKRKGSKKAVRAD